MDVSDAFTSITRDKVCQEVESACPELAGLAHAWLDAPSKHVCMGLDGEETRRVDQQKGLDQGCPLSPAFYALGVRPVLAATQAAMKEIDADALVPAYLDDTYLAGSLDSVERGVEILVRALRDRGLELNTTKTRIWTPDPTVLLPRQWEQYRVRDLKVVGSLLPCARRDRQATAASDTPHSGAPS